MFTNTPGGNPSSDESGPPTAVERVLRPRADADAAALQGRPAARNVRAGHNDSWNAVVKQKVLDDSPLVRALVVAAAVVVAFYATVVVAVVVAVVLLAAGRLDEAVAILTSISLRTVGITGSVFSVLSAATAGLIGWRRRKRSAVLGHALV
jgi:hypothetical protein